MKERVGPERGWDEKLGSLELPKTSLRNEVHSMRSLQNEKPSKHSLNELGDSTFICFRTLNDVALCFEDVYIFIYILSHFLK